MAVISKISVSVHIPTVNQRFDPFVSFTPNSKKASLTLRDPTPWRHQLMRDFVRRGVSLQRSRYSITSSARRRIDGGNVMPRALAVLRLITSSYLVGCWTGRSAGFSPLRMRPT